MKIKKLSFDAWTDKYKPIQNTVSNRDEYNGWMFETYGLDSEHIIKMAKEKPNNVWTVLTGTESGDVIVQGYHYVNRLCYFITEVPFDENENIEVHLDEED